jgi:hypothetical protein
MFIGVFGNRNTRIIVTKGKKAQEDGENVD